MLGAATVLGHAEFAVAMAIVTSAVLALKSKLHSFVGKIQHVELLAALRLLFATFIVLPILPRIPVDPWGALNPYRLWLLVVLISALSLLGYIAVRLFGQRRGIALTALSGGLVSSTAVTLAFSKRSYESKNLSYTLAAGIFLSWGVMFLRILIEISVVNMSLLSLVAPPMGAMTITCALASLFLFRKQSGADSLDTVKSSVVLKNPFSLTEASKFALFFALIVFLSKIIQIYFPGGGLYILAGLAGTSDVDAITLSTADMVLRGEVLPKIGIGAIVTASVVNTVVKIGLTMSFGSKELQKNILLLGALVLFVGLLAAWITLI